MSIKLLQKLNRKNTGVFSEYLAKLKGVPRIAWYPSAGQDFRGLLYLNERYSELDPVKKGFKEPAGPELFLFTDYFPHDHSTFLDTPLVFSDGRTKIEALKWELLPDLDLPVDRELVSFPEGGKATGKVAFLEVKVSSNKLGEFVVPVIYAFVENEAFCAKVLLENKAKLSHVIQVRYGGGMGGAGTRGLWVKNVLKRVGCEVFVGDELVIGTEEGKEENRKVARVYPSLAIKDQLELVEIRKVDGRGWSGHGDVSWNLVK